MQSCAQRWISPVLSKLKFPVQCSGIAVGGGRYWRRECVKWELLIPHRTRGSSSKRKIIVSSCNLILLIYWTGSLYRIGKAFLMLHSLEKINRQNSSCTPGGPIRGLAVLTFWLLAGLWLIPKHCLGASDEPEETARFLNSHFSCTSYDLILIENGFLTVFLAITKWDAVAIIKGNGWHILLCFDFIAFC